MAESRLHELSDAGVSVWIDSLSREMLDSGELASLIADDAVVGVTSNPTIFQKALAEGDLYDEQLREVAAQIDDPVEIFFALAHGGHQGRLRPDAPRLGADERRSTASSRSRSTRRSPTTASARSSRRCGSTRRSTGRTSTSRSRPPSPASARSRTASRKGVPINVTLIFSLERYAAVAEAYLRGLERLVAARRRPAQGDLRRELLRLARRHRGRQAARGGRPPGPAGEARGREREARLPALPRGLRRATAGRSSQARARGRSGACGRRPRRRTPPTAT